MKLGYTVAEAQEMFCGISKDTIYRLIKDGELEAFKIGIKIIIKKDSIEDFVKRKTIVNYKE